MIIVSACLAGIPCRWDGKAKSDERVMRLVREGRALPLCPEQLGGLTTPRESAEIRAGRVFSKSGADVTAQFQRGAEIVWETARQYGCSEAILKARSPSCGSGRIYDGSFSGDLVDGDGLTARLLKKKGILVRTEEEFEPRL
jgi:uncharacterized protein YbbK (DUF523 family)